MSTVVRFEDLKIWQRSREIVNQIYKISNEGSFSADYDLKRQIRRASISMMSNLAEGFEREGTKEFIQFLYVAKASGAEVRSQLYVAFDQHYISVEQFKELSERISTFNRMITSFIYYLKNSGLKGLKFKDEAAIYNGRTAAEEADLPEEFVSASDLAN